MYSKKEPSIFLVSSSLFQLRTLSSNCSRYIWINHLMIKGDSSTDTFKQQQYIQTIIDGINNQSENTIPTFTSGPVHCLSQDNVDTSNLNQTPYCFITDTDSIPYVIDTGANRIIVNDIKLLHNITATSDKVKGIGGKCVRITSIGKLSLALHAENGITDTVNDLDTVCVPSSPYNLLPPQLLVQQMKFRGFQVDKFKHDNKHFILAYTSPSLQKSSKWQIVFAHWF